MNEKELWKEAQRNVVEIEWWKNKLFRTMQIAIFQGIVFDYFTKDEREKVFEAYKKWRENRETNKTNDRQRIKRRNREIEGLDRGN